MVKILFEHFAIEVRISVERDAIGAYQAAM